MVPTLNIQNIIDGVWQFAEPLFEAFLPWAYLVIGFGIAVIIGSFIIDYFEEKTEFEEWESDKISFQDILGAEKGMDLFLKSEAYSNLSHEQQAFLRETGTLRHITGMHEGQKTRPRTSSYILKKLYGDVKEPPRV